MITVDTEHFRIDSKQGEWRVTDSIIFLGNQFYLMENEKYGHSVTSVIMDAYGKIVVDQVTKFDQAVKEKIQQYIDNKKPLTQQQQNPKQKKDEKRTSVILRLRKKQKLVAEKSGKSVPEYLQDLEHNRK